MLRFFKNNSFVKLANKNLPPQANNYSWAYRYMSEKPTKLSTVIDVGAFDLTDSISFAQEFDCNVIAFEADPSNALKCEKSIREMNQELQDKIQLDSRFLGSKSGLVTFHAIDDTKYKNKQASSRYILDFTQRRIDDPDFGIENVQKPIQVESIRYEDTGYPSPHTIFMDAQGSELEVLQGMGNMIYETRNIVLETSLKSNYIGASVFREIDKFLKDFGFKMRYSTHSGIIKPFHRPGRNPFANFDVIYIKR